MIIYSKTGLANLRLQKEAQEYLQKGCITDAEFKTIAQKHPTGFYMPTFFVRVGLLVLTFIISLFTFGLITLMFFSSIGGGLDGGVLFIGILSYAALELIIAGKQHFRSGVDDALLIISGSAIIGGFMAMLPYSTTGTDYLLLSAIIFLLSLLLSIRYAHLLMSAICCASFFVFVFLGWTKVIPYGLSSAPFTMMLVSATIYRLAYLSGKRLALINYQNCFTVAQIVALVSLYAAGNYYVIQNLGSELNGQANAPVPFGAFFWVWTILLPFVYVSFGLRRKDTLLLRTGLLLITAAVLTFRNYYHLLPVDVMLTLAGALVLGGSYAIMQYLKTPKHGFTYAEQDNGHIMDHLKVESLIVAETFSTMPSAPADQGVKFGGGDGGGGGSSGTF